jgi:hypothetical protein
MNLLTPYTHHLKQQVLMRISLISTLHESLHAMFSQSIFTSRFLVRNLNNGDPSASVVMPLPTGYTPQLNSSDQSQSYFMTGGLPPISSSWSPGPLRLTT